MCVRVCDTSSAQQGSPVSAGWHQFGGARVEVDFFALTGPRIERLSQWQIYSSGCALVQAVGRMSQVSGLQRERKVPIFTSSQAWGKEVPLVRSVTRTCYSPPDNRSSRGLLHPKHQNM